MNGLGRGELKKKLRDREKERDREGKRVWKRERGTGASFAVLLGQREQVNGCSSRRRA